MNKDKYRVITDLVASSRLYDGTIEKRINDLAANGYVPDGPMQIQSCCGNNDMILFVQRMVLPDINQIDADKLQTIPGA